MDKVNIFDKFKKFDDVYVPKVVGELNGQMVKLVRFHGPYLWHDHEDEDEMFLVLKGSIRVEFRDDSIEVNEGEFLIVPKGVEHRPVAYTEALVMLFEPYSTVNTGKVQHDYTKTDLDNV